MIRVAVALAFVPLTGCAGRLYDVHRGSQPIEGVPFYTVQGSCSQETVYLETLYQLTVQKPAQDKKPAIVLFERTIPASAYTSAAMQQLRDAINAPTATILTIRTRFDALKAYDPAAPPEVALVSNVTKADSYVDYANVHYINVSRPGIGTASASAKLNANGTLAEAQAEVEDKTAETILGAFPIKETLLGVVSAAGLPTAILESTDKEPVAVQLVVTPARFRHVLTKTEAGNPPCAAKPTLAMGDPAANTRREAIAESSGKSEQEHALELIGKIIMPKSGGG